MEFYHRVSVPGLGSKCGDEFYSFKLLQYTRMKVLIHVPVLEGIMGGFVRT
jgi:hypothetical protein